VNNPNRKVAIALAVLFLALFVNLNVVQVFQGGKYRNNSDNRRVLLNEYASPRGNIVATRGTRGSTNIAFSKKTGGELKYLRVYPKQYAEALAPVTGFYSFVYGTNGDAGGIEGFENDILSGDSSKLFTTKLANILTGRNPRGGSVQLTINLDAQLAAYNAMKGANGKLRRGAVVALDPTTGAILAMVSTPSYDPNELAAHNADLVQKAWIRNTHDKQNPMLNRALREIYPPGSVFKVIDTAAALKAGLTPDTRIAAPNSYWPLDPTKKSACPTNLAAACVQNFEGETCDNGKTATLELALVKSCNTAFAALTVERLGPQLLKDQAEAFGIDGSQLTVPMPVAPSTIGTQADLDDPAALAQTSFGQRDVRISPLQGAMISAAVANNGTLMRPYLVAKELRPNLSVLNSTEPQKLSQTMDPDVAGQLVTMMESVVTDPRGTGGPAKITDAQLVQAGATVGGKTGTADVGVTSASKVQPDAWFSGFAMVKGEPRIAVAVIIENGGVAGNESAGGAAAGPVAKQVITAYLKSVGVGK
jgi:peptidoglycan glycosyltransferase